MGRAGIGVVAAAVATAVAGCASKPPAQTELMRQVGTITISAEELRVRMSEFAEQFAGQMESAADEVRLASDDRRIDENALIWKIRMVNMAHDAAFRADPLVSLLDTWVLCRQALAFAESDAGASAFGEHRVTMVTASSLLLSRVEAIAGDIGTGERGEEGRRTVAAFAEEHPLEGQQLRRTSVAAEFAASTGLRASGALEAVGTLDRRAALLTAQLPFLTEFLPKQLAWQAELSFLQNASIVREELRLARLEGVEANLGRMAVSLEGVPDLVETEVRAVEVAIDDLATAQREEILAGVEAIVEGTLEEVRSERALILDAVAVERAILLEEAAALVATEREAALADVERQRLETIAAVQAERDEVVVEARTIVDDAVLSALDGASGVAMRAALGGGGLIGLGLVIGAVVLRTGRRGG